jgi:hypothetical protein
MPVPAVGDPGTDAVSPPADWASRLLARVGISLKDNGNLIGKLCRVSRATNQTGVVTSTLTKITFDAVRYGLTSWWSAGAPTRITVPTAGYYIVGASCEFDASATGARYADIFKNNTTILAELAGGGANTAADTPSLVGEAPVLLAANDYIEARVYQNSGANRTLLTEPWGPDMWAIFLGEA